MDNFAVDVEGSRGLWALINSIRQLEHNLSDTEMAAGSEAYQASLGFYNFVKLLAQQNVPGAKTVYQDLRTRFHEGRRRKLANVPVPDEQETS